jgi:hypothetical protein
MFILLYVPFSLYEFERIYLCKVPYKATKAIKALYVPGYITAMEKSSSHVDYQYKT